LETPCGASFLNVYQPTALANFMVQRSSLEVNIFSTSQEVLDILWNIKDNSQTFGNSTTFMINQMSAHSQSIRSTDFLGGLSLCTYELSRPNFSAGLLKITSS
jgi:hypothetical protein